MWFIAMLISFPAILYYTKFIDYSSQQSALPNSESARAQSILSGSVGQNDTLIVAINISGISLQTLANKTLSFQNAVMDKKIPFVSQTESVYTSYAKFIDKAIYNYTGLIKNTYYNLTYLSEEIYSFPGAFLAAWKDSNYSSASINESAYAAGYNGSGYEESFLKVLESVAASNLTNNPSGIVQSSILATAPIFYGKNPLIFPVLSDMNVTNYSSRPLNLTAELIQQFSNLSVHPGIIKAVIQGQDPGQSYVINEGLINMPSFLKEQFVSPNGDLSLIYIYFNVSSNYRGIGGFYPAQNATPAIRSLVYEYFGSAGELTGTGAITFDTQQEESGSGIIFALTFVFLAVAIAIVLGSVLAPLLSLLFVSLSIALGYISIFLTGALLFPVDFIVTYTLTAVLLGVSTDYLVFLLARYRSLLKEGISPIDAIKTAVKTSGQAIVVSGITVAAAFCTFFFIPGLKSWGPVLAISVILTVLLEVTLLPSITSFIGPRLFLKRSLRETSPAGYMRSKFYAAAKLASTKRLSTFLIITALTIPSVYVWYNLPTTYDFTQGIPANLPSVKTLSQVQSSFGSNLIFPNYVILNLTQPAFLENGSPTSTTAIQITDSMRYLSIVPGVSKVIGPISNSTTSIKEDSRFVINGGRQVYFLVYTDDQPYSETSINAIRTIRQNSSYIVGGITSSVIDQQEYASVYYPRLEILIVIAIALILAISFKSLSLPFIALSGVFISITWTTSILYVISTYILHQTLLYLIPVILFVMLMSLGNDYTVFIISRIREEQATLGFREGLLKGMASSGAVVTALGMILAISLGSLGLAHISFLQQMGVAFFISLLIDTFVIRTFYFPAMISIFEERKGESKKPRDSTA